jgi:acyl-CoA thioesterase-1
MSSVALHFASGAAFFSGSACFLAGLLVVTLAQRKWLPPMGRFLILAGLFLVAASATPLPLWAWCVWGASFVGWATSRYIKVAGTLRVPSSVATEPSIQTDGRHTECACYFTLLQSKRLTAAALVTVVGCTVATVVWEISFQLPPHLPAGHWNRLVVIGDSLSAADFTEGGDPWPTLIAHHHKFDVVNLAFSGAKAGSAEKQVSSDQVNDALVVLEIGGNDLLGATTPADFERDLERLLQKVCRSDNAVVMLELPLPPLYNRFGEIQRRLARRHHVVLIPKRYFAGVLAGADSTVDGLHLSRVGHRKMAEMIFGVVSPSLVH